MIRLKHRFWIFQLKITTGLIILILLGCMTACKSNPSDSGPTDPPTDVVFTLEVIGAGIVNGNRGEIFCDNNCRYTLDSDAAVDLTAEPSSGYVFQEWRGVCSGNGPCTFTITQDCSVSAVFVEDSGPQNGLKIEEYSAPDDAFALGEIPNNASGITWHETLQQYLIVQNNSADIYRYDRDFTYLGKIHISHINQDTEGLGFVGGNEVMVVTESNYAHKLVIDEWTEYIDGNVSITQGYRLLPFPPSTNAGLEGVTVRKAADGIPERVYAGQEGGGGEDMRVVYFDLPVEDPLVLLSYDSNLTVVEPFDADEVLAGYIRDIAGMYYDDRTGHLIILSQQSRKAIQVNPVTGAVISTLELTGAPQFEGVTMGPNGELVFVSEPNWIRIYTRPF